MIRDTFFITFVAATPRVRELEVTVSIDDFGRGYSSLSYIAKLPINALKIDRSFIVEMPNSPDSMSIVLSILLLAHSLGLKVVAEGVDSEDQVKLLKLLRCDEVQGYYFSKPLPSDNVAEFIRKVIHPALVWVTAVGYRLRPPQWK